MTIHHARHYIKCLRLCSKWKLDNKCTKHKARAIICRQFFERNAHINHIQLSDFFIIAKFGQISTVHIQEYGKFFEYFINIKKSDEKMIQ